MAGSLVESLAADFDPSAFTDEYRQAVLDLVAQKLAGEDVILPSTPAASDDSGTVIDLMAALQESVRRTQAARAANAEPEAEDAPAKPRKASRAKKA